MGGPKQYDFMKYSLRTEHLTLTDFDQQQLEKKLNRLGKHLLPPFVIDISLLHDTHHQRGPVVTCIINIEQGRKVFHADRSAESIQDAIDRSLQAVAKELRKEHSKHKKHQPRR